MSAAAFLTQTMTYSPHSGSLDRYGNTIPGASSSVRCKFMVKSGFITAPGGEEVSYNAIAYIALTQSAALDDKVVFNSDQYRIIDITEQRGTVTNLKHKKLFLQRLAATV